MEKKKKDLKKQKDFWRKVKEKREEFCVKV